jgi:hypothetical protein
MVVCSSRWVGEFVEGCDDSEVSGFGTEFVVAAA